MDKTQAPIWPRPYFPVIKNLLKQVPQVENLLDSINADYHYPGDTEITKGTSAKIFGGFLRWIVETSEPKNGIYQNLDIHDLIDYGGDIDIMVLDYPDCGRKLSSYFGDLMKQGARIEYAGMTYGQDTPLKIAIDVTKCLQYGNYMIWIPFPKVEPLVTPEESAVEIEITKPSPIRQGISFADAAKMSQKQTATATKAIQSCDRWLKLDILFCRNNAINTDFTVNTLSYPVFESSRFHKIAVMDIKNRRIVPVTSDYTTKICFRLLKLHRRGYKFGVGHPSDRVALEAILKSTKVEEIRSRSSQNKKMLPVGFAFGDTSSPSSDGKPGVIRSTKHILSLMTHEYVSSLPTYRDILSSIDATASCDWGDDVYAYENFTSEDRELITFTKNERKVYKIVLIENEECGDLKTEVCLELIIPPQTRYARCGITHCSPSRYSTAYIGAIYAYPCVDITEFVKKNSITVRSIYDRSFLYVNKGVPVNPIVARPEKPKQATEISTNNYHGIYAYPTMLRAWDHNGFYDVLIGNDIGKFQTSGR